MHGARGVILINDAYPHHTPAEDRLDAFGKATGPTDSGVLFVQVKEATAEAWLKTEGRDLHEILDGIDQDLKPRSFPLTKLTASMTLDIQHDMKTVHNVAAYIPGKTKEYVIIGAHYDHLGLGDEHSLAPSQIGTIHPGADDNASGTAGVIELARWFSKQPQQQRGILFMTFAGEELGLLGSNYYTGHPLLPLENAVTMINMDMIGRIRGGKVYVNGTGTGSTLDKLVESVKPPESFKLDLVRSHRLRRQRSHVLHREAGAGAVLLQRPARRLSQAQRYLGQDRRARRRQAPGLRRADRDTPGERLRTPQVPARRGESRDPSAPVEAAGTVPTSAAFPISTSRRMASVSPISRTGRPRPKRV